MYLWESHIHEGFKDRKVKMRYMTFELKNEVRYLEVLRGGRPFTG